MLTGQKTRNRRWKKAGKNFPASAIAWSWARRSPQSGVAQIVLTGEHDLASVEQLQNTLDQSLASCSHVIVDVSSAEFIDTSTIHVLVRAKKAANQRNRRFNLVLGTTSLVERVFEITGVLEFLNRVHSPEEALQHAS
jgi:anti-anti-sigma factor